MKKESHVPTLYYIELLSGLFLTKIKHNFKFCTVSQITRCFSVFKFSLLNQYVFVHVFHAPVLIDLPRNILYVTRDFLVYLSTVVLTSPLFP